MKHLFTLFTALCISVTAFAQTLFTTNFATVDDFNAWTVVNANEDDKTWTFDEWGEPSKVFYSYHGNNAADDWLISPAITSAESGALVVTFEAQGSSYTEKLELFCGAEPTVAAMTQQVSPTLKLNGDVTSHVYIVDVTANEPLYLGFHACSDADKWRLYLCKVTALMTANPVDLAVTEFVTPVSAFDLGHESVTVKIKNAGTVPVESFDVSFSVDENTTVTETVNRPLSVGEEFQYTFNATADLSEPRKNFNIKAWTSHPDEINPGNDAISTTVLHKAPASVPYFMGFESAEYTDDITYFNLNEDEGNWDLYADPYWNMAHTGDCCLAYNYDKNNDANDWAILEPIVVTDPGYYVLKFWYSGDDIHPEKLGVYYGNAPDPSAMTNKIVEFNPFARDSYEESINIVYIDVPQTIYIGFYAFSNKDENWICVDDVTFEKIESEAVDIAVTEVINPLNYVHQSTKPTVEVRLRNYGITDVNTVLTCSIDGEVVYEKSQVLSAQANVVANIACQFANLPEGVHELTVALTADEDQNMDNNSKTLEFRVMGAPTKIWGFESGELPADFTFRAEDGGTVNPSAGDEFNDAGWGIFNIQEHELYGCHVLAGTSWLNGTEEADRWCVLPPFAATDASHLVWDVCSFNPNFLEDYAVMVSTSGDDSNYYFTEERYVCESSTFKTRGLDLSEYAGQTIHIAFRLTSENCEHLILDNIALYGGDVSSSIDDVERSNIAVNVGAETITVTGVNVDAIELIDMKGAKVAVANGNEVSIRGLAAGVYLVRVASPFGIDTKKVVIK